VDFKDLKLERVIFSQADLSGATFENVDLIGAKFDGALLLEAHFKHLNLEGANFNDLLLSETTFENVDLIGARFDGALLREAHFKDLNLEGANFNDSLLSGTTFENVDLIGATFDGAFLKATFVGTGNKFSNGTKRADFSQAFWLDDHTRGLLQASDAKVVMTPKDELKFAARLGLRGLPDMIEALILEGRLDEAKEKLSELKESLPKDNGLTSVDQGEFRLLSLLYTEIAGAPREKVEEAKGQWCDWLGQYQYHQLNVWNWETWNEAIRYQHLTQTTQKEISQIEDSAMGRPRRDPFCGGGKLPASTRSHSSDK
jgi:hypothetical protein